MRRILRLPSHSVLVAIAVLILAGAGAALAADPPHATVAASVTSTAKKAAKKYAKSYSARYARRFAVRGPEGPRGPEGQRGPVGSQGPKGDTGANGSPAFGALLGRGVNVPASTSFLAPSGQLAADANENNVSSFTPNANMTASDLAVTLTVATGLTDTRTFTLRVGNANTALSCTVPAGNVGCTSTGSVTIPAASLISIGSTSTGTPLPTDVRFGWRATS